MTSPLVVKDTHPARGFVGIAQIGFKAHDLGVAHQTILEARLPGVLDTLAKDLDALGLAVPGAAQKRSESVAATATQDALTRQGHAQVRAVRQIIRKASAPLEVQRAYGVGRAVSAASVRDVSAALQQIVDRAAAVPEEAKGFGLVPADVDALRAFLAQLAAANATQEKKRAGAPLSTKQRNLIGNRILQTAALIAGTGMRAFVTSPPDYASFEALMASTHRPRKNATTSKTPASSPPPPASSAIPTPPRPPEPPAA